jgi:hypothetical protein
VTETLPAPELAAYPPPLVELAARAWPLRAEEELRSAMIYRALRGAARRLTARMHGWERRLARVMGDELRHARLCAHVGACLGAPRPRHDLEPVRRRVAALPTAHARLTSLLVVEAAMGETVSAALFRASYDGAREPLTRAALRVILRDELEHARTAWDALSQHAEDDRTRAALPQAATAGLGILERDVAVPALRRLEAGAAFEPRLAALGVLDPERRVAIFYRTVEGSLLPRLERLGVDAARAWRDRHTA